MIGAGKMLLKKRTPEASGPTDYDFIARNNFTQTGTFKLAAYRGSLSDVVTSFYDSIFYRKKGDVVWTSLNTSGQAVIDEVGEWEFGNDWNKSGDNCLTISFLSIAAIDACTYIYINSDTLGATVGSNFLYQAWYNCSNLASMPAGFNLPQNITSVGDYFLQSAWYDCSSLASMPAGFNLPQNITSVGGYFLQSAWRGCSILASMPVGFNLPQNITSVGGFFLQGAWYNCSNLASMPAGFNLPQNITSVGGFFLQGAWRDCSSLASMPAGFNLPQNITSVGSAFLFQAWFNCADLNNDATTEDLDFPTSDYASTGIFGGTCPITPDDVTGPYPQAIAVNRT